MEELAKAVEEKEVWKRIEKIKGRVRQPDVGLLHLYGQQKKAARRAVEMARNNMEEVYNKLEEDGGRKMIYKLAHDHDGDGKEGSVITDGGGRLMTEKGAVLKVWGGYFKELLNRERSNGEMKLPVM